MNDATEIYILKKRIAYLESILSAHNISFDAPDVPSNQSIIVPISAVISPTHARFFYSLFHGRSDVYAKRAVMKNCGDTASAQKQTVKRSSVRLVPIAAGRR